MSMRTLRTGARVKAQVLCKSGVWREGPCRPADVPPEPRIPFTTRHVDRTRDGTGGARRELGDAFMALSFYSTRKSKAHLEFIFH